MRNRFNAIGHKESDSNSKVYGRSGPNRRSDMRNRFNAIGYKESDSASWYTYSFSFCARITCPIMKGR